jgi:hypothetical protein
VVNESKHQLVDQLVKQASLILSVVILVLVILVLVNLSYLVTLSCYLLEIGLHLPLL